MSFRSRWSMGLLLALFVMGLAIASQRSFGDEDLVHVVSGTVKSIDRGTKTVVIKATDGTEHTIKYTDKTVVEGTKDTGKGIEKGSAETYLGAKKGGKVTVKYTEKAGEKTAVGVKDAVY
jgi:hypothetical protein